MTDVPEDVRKLARSAALDVFAAAVDSDDDSHALDNDIAFDIIEAALMAERKQCAAIADKWATDEQRKFGDGGPAAAIMKGPTT